MYDVTLSIIYCQTTTSHAVYKLILLKWQPSSQGYNNSIINNSYNNRVESYHLLHGNSEVFCIIHVWRKFIPLYSRHSTLQQLIPNDVTLMSWSIFIGRKLDLCCSCKGTMNGLYLDNLNLSQSLEQFGVDLTNLPRL